MLTLHFIDEETRPRKGALLASGSSLLPLMTFPFPLGNGRLSLYWTEVWTTQLHIWLFTVYCFLSFFFIVVLQCCLRFCCTAKWFSYTYMIYINLFFLFQILFHYSFLTDIKCSSLCHTVGLYCLSILL